MPAVMLGGHLLAALTMRTSANRKDTGRASQEAIEAAAWYEYEQSGLTVSGEMREVGPPIAAEAAPTSTQPAGREFR